MADAYIVDAVRTAGGRRVWKLKLSRLKKYCDLMCHRSVHWYFW